MQKKTVKTQKLTDVNEIFLSLRFCRDCSRPKNMRPLFSKTKALLWLKSRLVNRIKAAKFESSRCTKRLPARFNRLND